ncbi:MAG: hypothetical protein A2664_01165 [Candidatus Taylorbacteria bacterium RIFCSPHIGHO2_01_FULL_46_22b]|uniref:Zinc finger DksA/TraR C4-type domain-containing protein n=1 Tax=Candidatus Taylorbacteria bacterium RIFCSPHIGHO2_01_FULL_46_22b TaxID=1802301 RepID=A0A1G2M2D9_9BACT|nr:MAG: hypothetical protein A2664_01165 [Candidatus Taylorbacteria bacterium RIFCSPHIGHO2_01_FULL_46_22b]
MDTTTQKKLQQALEAELKKVEGELRSVGRVNPTNPKDWEAMPDKMDIITADPNEVADSIESYEENTGILKQLEIRLNEIKAALEGMKTGIYGTCSVCGKPIDPKRLEANPAAATCIEHAR